MHNHRTLVGLDVHAKATIAAGLELDTGELRFRRINGPPRSAVNYLEELPGPVMATYEAGPVGYGLAREAAARRIEVRVCAPGSIPRKPGERIKTTGATLSGWRAPCSPGSCRSCAFRPSRRSSSEISPAAGKPHARI